MALNIEELEIKFLARLAQLEPPYPSINDLRYQVYSMIANGDIIITVGEGNDGA